MNENINTQKSSKPDSKFLQDYNRKNSTKPEYKKRKDLLEGYVFRNSFEIPLNPYTKMVLTLYESSSKPGLYRVEQRIGYNKLIWDGNLLFVVAENLKELDTGFVPEDLKPKKEGSS